jgi:polyisoprenoid-binding protein YceI
MNAGRGRARLSESLDETFGTSDQRRAPRASRRDGDISSTSRGLFVRQSAPTRPPAAPFLLAGLLLAVAVGAGGLWYLFLRPSGPLPVLDGSHGASAAPTASGSEASRSPATAAPAQTPGTSMAGGSGGLTGAWEVDPSIGSFRDFSGSFVGYRVQEQLVNVGGNTAVGRTPNVSGTLNLAGTTVPSASFSAQLSGLTSDDSRRDGRVDDALDVRQHPAATFVLGMPIELGSIPAAGQEIKATASGKLTIRGVTRDVAFPLTAALNRDVLTVKGSLEILLADFGVPKPSSFLVLSIADNATIEVQLQLTRDQG